MILHVRRHYSPRDQVLSWDAAGRLSMSPTIPGTLSEPGLVVYLFSVGLFYANAEHFSEEALGLVDVPNPPRWFVLDARAIDDIDYTGGKTDAELVDQLAERRIVFAVVGASPHVRDELDRFGITERIGQDHYFDSLRAARDAFNRVAK